MICGGPGCSRPLPFRDGPGRPQSYCSGRCAKRAQAAARRLRKASDLVDLIRSAPTMVAVTALASLREADLDRAAGIAAWKGSRVLSGDSPPSGSSGNYIDEIVAPQGETP